LASFSAEVQPGAGANVSLPRDHTIGDIAHRDSVCAASDWLRDFVTGICDLKSSKYTNSLRGESALAIHSIPWS